MDDRTYPHPADSDAEQAPPCVPYAEFAFYAAEVERLTHDLADAQTVANLQRDLHAAELDKHRRELTALRDERPRLLAANVRLFHDNNALRAELDAMRQAHSVIAARMEAMGC